MNITGGIVLFAVIWFMVFFIVLPIRFQSQEEAGGDVTPGTPASAPADADVGRKARITTVIAVVIWAMAATVILSGWISVRDLDLFNRMAPEAGQPEG